MKTFLTADELKVLTGRTWPSHQIKWLAEHGWPFETDSFNRPVVLRSVMECRLGSPESEWTLNESNVA